MHTVISAFANRREAEAALQRLRQEGIAAEDMHLRSGEADLDAGMDRATWDSMEREVAVDRGVLESLGHFFTSLFGQDNPSGHTDSYSRAVEQGGCVLVLDARDEAQARRASDLLVELGGQTNNVVHRPLQRPLREIVGARTGRDPAGASFDGQAGARAVREEQGERAFAFGGGQRQLDLGGADDPRHAPGLRYGDKDKPNG